MNFEYEKPFEFNDEEIKEAFDTMDIYKKGYLTSEEITLFLDILGISSSEKEIEEMVRMADSQMMGKVFLDEFTEMSKGKLLSPIGVALPPTLPLLQGTDISQIPFIMAIYTSPIFDVNPFWKQRH